jgi:hypothetical protein
MILTGLRVLSISARFFGWLPLAMPLAARPYITPVSMAMIYMVNWIESAVHAHTLSNHALIYVGLTGTPFMPSAKRARVLTTAVEGASEGKYKRKFKTEREWIQRSCHAKC